MEKYTSHVPKHQAVRMSWTIPLGPDWECASVEMEQAYINFPRDHKSAMWLKQWFNKPAMTGKSYTIPPIKMVMTGGWVMKLF